MGTTLSSILKEKYRMLEPHSVFHAHVKTVLTGIVLSENWLKLDINETDFFVDALGGWTFDEGNNRFIWDAADELDMDLVPIFIGDSAIEVTSGIGAGVSVAIGIFVNGNLILETEVNFTSISRIKSLGANDLVINDATNDPLIVQGSYVEFFIRAGSGETPTIQIDNAYMTLSGR